MKPCARRVRSAAVSSELTLVPPLCSTNAGSEAEWAVEVALPVLAVVEVLCVAVVPVLAAVCDDEGGTLDTDTVLVWEPQPPSSVPPAAPRTIVAANSTPRLIVSGYSPPAAALLAAGVKRELDALLAAANLL